MKKPSDEDLRAVVANTKSGGFYQPPLSAHVAGMMAEELLELRPRIAELNVERDVFEALAENWEIKAKQRSTHALKCAWDAKEAGRERDALRAKLEAVRGLCVEHWINLDGDRIRAGLWISVEDVLDILDDDADGS